MEPGRGTVQGRGKRDKRLKQQGVDVNEWGDKVRFKVSGLFIEAFVCGRLLGELSWLLDRT